MNKTEEIENTEETIEDEKKEENLLEKQEASNSWYMKLAAFIDRINYSMFRNVLSATGSIYVSRMNSLELALKISLAIILFLGFMVVYLINSVVTASDSRVITVSVPTEVSSGLYTVRKNSATVEYFELIARGFVSTVSNYNYMDAEKKINSILPSILPYTYTATFNDIKRNVQFIVNNKVNQKYVIQKVETIVKGSRAKIIFTGLLTRKVGSITILENKPYEIPIIIKMVNYTPYIESFNFKDIGILKKDNKTKLSLDREEKKARDEKLKKQKKKAALKKQKAKDDF